MEKQRLRKRRVQIRTRNHSARPLRGNIMADRSAIVRLGSLTTLEDAYTRKKNLNNIIEINTVEAVQNSRDKFAMKKCFDNAKISHADYYIDSTKIDDSIDYPIVAKRKFGFKGRGMYLLCSRGEFLNFMEKQYDKDYFFEKFYNYAREYRLHICNGQIFMVWRKLRKKDAEERWYFNDSNCNWVSEQHELFNKPVNWKDICKHSIKAMKAVGLDLGAVDVRVQSDKHETPLFIICEVNSAPALGNRGIEEYKKQIQNFIDNYEK